MNPFEIDEMNKGVGREVNYKKIFLKLLKRWPVILLFFLLSIAVGYAINRYATPIYLVKAKIITKKFSNRSASPIPGLVDAGYFLGGMTEVYEEIPLLKSYSKIEETIERLDFTVSYFSEGLIKTTQTFTGHGFKIEIDSITGKSLPYNTPIFVNHESTKTYKLKTEDSHWKSVFDNQVFTFGEPSKVEDIYFKVYNTNGKSAESDKYYFILNRKSDLVDAYRSRLNISWAQQGSAILDLKIQSALPEKDLKFLTTYYEVVEEKGLEEKNEKLSNTIAFIDEQMASITDSLIHFQEVIDNLKLENRELTLGSEFVYQKLNDIDEQKAEILLNERYYDYLTKYMRSNRISEVFAPSLIGLDAPLLDGLVNQYISQRMQEKYYRNEANAQNPLVNREDSLRRKLEKNIYESIRSYRKRNEDELRELDQQTEFLFSSVKDLQTEFRQLNRFQRLYELNQSLFDLFLRRKTEAAISKASATSDYETIDSPSFSKNPIRPDTKNNLLIAAVLGLTLPVAFFFIKDMTNSRILDKDDLMKHTDIPLLGNIAHSTAETNLVIKEKPKSVVSESFRAVRANLNYLSNQPADKCTTYLITSSIGGEGKTFCSLNLAYTFALSDKKTVLIGADLRKPTLTDYLESYPGKGLAEYLAGFVDMSETIVSGETENLSFIGAGSVPPNPSELLSGDRMGELMAYLKERYDYIIIDTSPIGLVSDAMGLFQYADHNMLIVRQKVSRKQALSMINELYVEGKLKNFTVIFNDLELIKRRNSYYGGYVYGMGHGGYGYGYYEEDKKKKRWWWI